MSLLRVWGIGTSVARMILRDRIKNLLTFHNVTTGSGRDRGSEDANPDLLQSFMTSVKSWQVWEGVFGPGVGSCGLVGVSPALAGCVDLPGTTPSH